MSLLETIFPVANILIAVLLGVFTGSISLIILEFTFVSASVSIFKYTLAIHFILVELPCVLAAVDPGFDTLTVHLIIDPFTVIRLTTGELADSVAEFLALEDLALIHITVVSFQQTLARLLPILPVTFIEACSTLINLCACTILHASIKATIVNISIDVCKNTTSSFLTIFVLAKILGTIGQILNTLALLQSIFPLALESPTICVDHLTNPVELVIFPMTFVKVTIEPMTGTVAMTQLELIRVLG